MVIINEYINPDSGELWTSEDQLGSLFFWASVWKKQPDGTYIKELEGKMMGLNISRPAPLSTDESETD